MTPIHQPNSRVSRRHFLTVCAAAVGCLAAGPARAAEPVVWKGVALGAAGQITLIHGDRDQARAALDEVVAEIARLERLFSLYRADSALVALNRDGRLEAPPLDLLMLLGKALAMAEASDGLFDPTVQPLWALHARHFGQPDADPRGPSQAEIEAARALVGHRLVRLSPTEIELTRPGMALTLNGIAQGHVTDRVAELLRARGFEHVLVGLGEVRGHGGPWQVGLPGGNAMSLADGAVATSSPDGTRFSRQCHHLFDPATGRSCPTAATVSILAPSAMLADGASTALALAPPDRRARLAQRLGVTIL